MFGALIAASVPLLLSITAVLSALGFLQALGHVIPISSAVSSVVLLIGMAVSVAYSLFHLRREREDRQRGRDFKEALQVTARTSGHAVAVSGVTVMLCLSGLYLTGMDVFRRLAVGTTIVVGLTVIGSMTVLPAPPVRTGPPRRQGQEPLAGPPAHSRGRVTGVGRGGLGRRASSAGVGRRRGCWRSRSPRWTCVCRIRPSRTACRAPTPPSKQWPAWTGPSPVIRLRRGSWSGATRWATRRCAKRSAQCASGRPTPTGKSAPRSPAPRSATLSWSRFRRPVPGPTRHRTPP